MSFFDNYEDVPQGNWLSAEEKTVLMENGIPIEITAISDDDHAKHGPRYVLTANVPNPESGAEESRLIGFPKGSGVESRNRMLAAMKNGSGDYPGLDHGGEPVAVKIQKAGNAHILVPA